MIVPGPFSPRISASVMQLAGIDRVLDAGGGDDRGVDAVVLLGDDGDHLLQVHRGHEADRLGAQSQRPADLHNLRFRVGAVVMDRHLDGQQGVGDVRIRR